MTLNKFIIILTLKTVIINHGSEDGIDDGV